MPEDTYTCCTLCLKSSPSSLLPFFLSSPLIICITQLEKSLYHKGLPWYYTRSDVLFLHVTAFLLNFTFIYVIIWWTFISFIRLWSPWGQWLHILFTIVSQHQNHWLAHRRYSYKYLLSMDYMKALSNMIYIVSKQEDTVLVRINWILL